MKPRYLEPEPISKEQAEAVFAAGSAEEITAALVGLTFHCEDGVWVQARCTELARHPDPSVRGLVATCIGHLARIHRSLDIASAEAVLERLAADENPSVAGRVGDAWDDIHRFVGQGG